MHGTMAFRVRRILYAGESGHQDKRRPIIRMGITLPDLDHSLSQCQSAVRVIEQAAVESFHEVRGAVVNVPQRQKQALRPRRKQAAYKTDESSPAAMTFRPVEQPLSVWEGSRIGDLSHSWL